MLGMAQEKVSRHFTRVPKGLRALGSRIQSPIPTSLMLQAPLFRLLSSGLQTQFSSKMQSGDKRYSAFFHLCSAHAVLYKSVKANVISTKRNKWWEMTLTWPLPRPFHHVKNCLNIFIEIFNKSSSGSQCCCGNLLCHDMITTWSPMIGQYFDTMIVASSDC